MPLSIVSTPIGNPKDITLHALELLKAADIIIVEEFKECTRLLRALDISHKTYEQLNEHSNKEDVQRLAQLCLDKEVCLITDCGTPGFCDPGTDLVKVCRKLKIPIKTAPGPSSLMTLLSLSSQRLDQFIFRGFLPAENEARTKALEALQKEKLAIIILDTPYRLQKTLAELKQYFSQRRALIAMDLTQSTELIFDGAVVDLDKFTFPKKAEFLVLIYP